MGDHALVSSASMTVRAIIDWSRPIDLGQMEALFDASAVSPRLGPKRNATSPDSELPGAPLGGSHDAIRQAVTPMQLARLDPSTAPRILIQHGTDDQSIPAQPSGGFASAIATTVGPGHAMTHIMPGARQGGLPIEAPSNPTPVLGCIANTSRSGQTGSARQERCADHHKDERDPKAPFVLIGPSYVISGGRRQSGRRS